MSKKNQAIIYAILGIILPAAQVLAETAADHSLNPLGNTDGGAPELYGRVIRLLLGFTGVASLLFFIWGGIEFLTSRGNQDKIKSGRDTIVWAVIGLFVSFSSYIILRYVIQSIIPR